MYLKEDYRAFTTRIMVLDNDKEISRRTEKRRVYKDQNGTRLIRSYGHTYPLNKDNEWRQPVSHILR